MTTDAGAHIDPVLRFRNGEQALGFNVVGGASAVVVTTRRLLVTADTGQHWEERREPPNLLTTQPLAVHFVSRVVGFAAGCAHDRAALYRTANGGRSWQTLAVPAGSACDPSLPLCVASARVLYYLAAPAPAAVVGAAGTRGPLDGTLYASRDSGSSWRRVGPAPETVLACSGPTVWAYSFGNPAMNFEPYVVFVSRDGGRSFTAVAGSVAKVAPFAGLGGPYRAITLMDGGLYTLRTFGLDDAVLVTGCSPCQAGHDLAVSATTDGGSRWSGPYNVLAAGLSYYPSQPVSFVSPRVGFVSGPWSQGAGEVLVATRDGGRRWRQLAVLGAGG